MPRDTAKQREGEGEEEGAEGVHTKETAQEVEEEDQRQLSLCDYANLTNLRERERQGEEEDERKEQSRAKAAPVEAARGKEEVQIDSESKRSSSSADCRRL